MTKLPPTQGFSDFRAAMCAGDADGANRTLRGIPSFYGRYPITPLMIIRPEEMTPEWLASPIGVVCGVDPPDNVYVWYNRDHNLDHTIVFQSTRDFDKAVMDDDLDGARRALAAMTDPDAIMIFDGQNPTDIFMSSPLSISFACGTARMTRMLLEAGLRPRHAIDFEGAIGSNWEISDKVELLLDHGLDPNACLPSEYPLLKLAIGQPGIMGMLLEHGAVATASALVLAAIEPELETAKLLIEYGAPVAVAIEQLKLAEAGDEYHYKLWDGALRDVCLSTWFTWTPEMHWRAGATERGAIRALLYLQHITPLYGQLPIEIMFILFEHLCTVVVHDA